MQYNSSNIFTIFTILFPKIEKHQLRAEALAIGHMIFSVEAEQVPGTVVRIDLVMHVAYRQTLFPIYCLSWPCTVLIRYSIFNNEGVPNQKFRTRTDRVLVTQEAA